MTSRQSKSVPKLQLERRSLFRYELRHFQRFSEDAARDSGVTLQQYQLLLHTQGFPGREWASIGEIAERLQALPHATAMLATRCEQARLVERRPNADDARVVEVHLTPKGRACLNEVVVKLDMELGKLADVISRTRAGVKGLGH